MNFLTINYNGCDKNAYKSINLSIRNQTISFETGNPIVDYYQYVKYRYEYIPNEIIMCSSTVDNFTDDCGYTWQYINGETGEFISDDEIKSWYKNSLWENFDKHLSVICSNRIKTRKGYDKHIRNWYKFYQKSAYKRKL